MKKVHLFFVNVFMLTVVSLTIQFVSINFNVYITNKIGAEGIGLFHLILSLYTMAVTFSASGISLTVTRLVSEHLAVHKDTSVSFILKRCFIYSAFFGIIAFLVLFFKCEFLGLKVLNDERTVMPLKILSFSLPFVAFSSVLNGYFTAVRKVSKSALSQLFALIIKIFVTVYLLNTKSINVLFAGIVTSEMCEFLILCVLYLFEKKKFSVVKKNKVTEKMLKIALPVAFSTYLRTGLNSFKQIIIPKGLVKSGQLYKKALSDYGVINGMVFPIITFPMNILYSCSNMLVPELSECLARGNTLQIRRIVKKALKTTVLFSVPVFIFCLVFHESIASLIYKNNDAGKFLLILCPIILTMYIDAVADGVLKGLNQQLYSMKYNILDSALSVILLLFLLPRYGLYGYIAVIYASEIFNTTLSLMRLKKVVFD
ncbi:MAG: oligosaccharide flippase family protein [Clostridia bacterium]|nr:oligosaccharide flippase family protein [Clostridia bacterium]